MKKNFVLLACFFTCGLISSLFSQEYKLKKEVSVDEARYLKQIVEEISETDQQYRNYLGKKTLDEVVIAKMDSVYDAYGMEAGLKYEMSLNLSLDKEVEDSLWQLQWENDLKNHLILRSIFEKYGFLPKELLGEYHYVQTLLLMHPPAHWDVEVFLQTYSQLLMGEVKIGRMPAKSYAQFYDIIKAKILREHQLYGTCQQFDPKSKSLLPPQIKDIVQTNQARELIGLPPLKEGEYSIQIAE